MVLSTARGDDPVVCETGLEGHLRDMFPGYYKPTKAELGELWAGALIVLDTNALFNLFRYTNATREAFLNVLATKHERLWLPHQVGLEFQRGRLSVIEDQAKAFTDLISKTKAALATLTKDVGALRNHPTLDLDELRNTVETAITTIESKIEATREKYQAEVLDAARHDQTTDVITELYTGRVGDPYTEARLKDLYEQGATRYEKKQPPGYKDTNKPEPDRYGDFILWMQLLDKGEADKTAVIFVGDDQKEDWWREFKGRKIGPRVELIDEFRQRAGQRIYFLTPQALMALAQQHGDSGISQDTVQEIAQVSEAQARQDAERVITDFASNSRNPFRVSRDLDPFSRDHTRDKLLTQRLERIRRKDEINLRSALRLANELELRGDTETDEYENIQRSISRLRRRVASASAELKEVEFQASLPTAYELTELNMTRFPSPDLIQSARNWLMHRGRPVVGIEGDWSEVPSAVIASLIMNIDGEIDPEFARFIRRYRSDSALDSDEAYNKWTYRPHSLDHEVDIP